MMSLAIVALGERFVGVVEAKSVENASHAGYGCCRGCGCGCG
jgi:hypothetical protein